MDQEKTPQNKNINGNKPYNKRRRNSRNRHQNYKHKKENQAVLSNENEIITDTNLDVDVNNADKAQEFGLSDEVNIGQLDLLDDVIGEASKKTEITDDSAKVEVVGIRFNKVGKLYYFSPVGIKLKKGEFAIVETLRGLEFGQVCKENHFVTEKDIVQPLRPVVRIATRQDIFHNEENKIKERDAFKVCLKKIEEYGLDMKLVDSQYTFDNSKLLFYFTSSGRVDFRDLVKELAAIFRTRIELRQIGIRDEAKLMGGLGMCGRPLCCSTFLSDFAQVSIKMAKEQNLSLNSTKISGNCGRLMCCLNYEYDAYLSEIQNTPPIGSVVKTEGGIGTVTDIFPISGMINVKLNDKPDTPPQKIHRDNVKVISTPEKNMSDFDK